MTRRRDVLAMGGGLVAAAQGLRGARAQSGPAAVRFGWQPTTTVQAQIAHTLAKTDVLERNRLSGTATMFSFGPAVNEALLSGAVDLGFIGDMPSVSLTATGAPVTILARMSTFRGSILASPGSGVRSVGDLKGKRLHGPFGSSIYLAALGMLRQAGLQPGRDVELVNMAFADIADALRAGRVEAVFVWDPWIALYEANGLAKEVASDTSLTMVVAARNDWLRANADAAERFLRAQKEALLWAAGNKETTNRWFREPEPARALPEPLVERTTAFDPQWDAKELGQVRVSFTAAERERYQGLARAAHDLRITPRLSPVADRLDMSIAERVDSSTWEFDPKSIRIKG